MKVAIVFGFLGAGKTTLIRHLLATTVAPGQVAVLVNDFGQVNVDGVALRGEHLRVLPLASGCICCSLSGAFVPAVEELHAQWQPDWLVIEPTGVAAPYALEALLRGQRLARIAQLACVLTVVDASRFSTYRPRLGEFYTAQVEQADLIVMNKTDLATDEQRAETEAALRTLNPTGRLLPTQFGQVDWQALLSIGSSAAQVSGHVHTPQFETTALVLRAQTRAELERAFAALGSGDYGQIYRAKGIAQIDGASYLINYVDGHLDLEATTATPTDLIIIGRKLDLSGWSR
jgi:G3E family GTPase